MARHPISRPNRPDIVKSRPRLYGTYYWICSCLISLFWKRAATQYLTTSWKSQARTSFVGKARPVANSLPKTSSGTDVRLKWFRTSTKPSPRFGVAAVSFLRILLKASLDSLVLLPEFHSTRWSDGVRDIGRAIFQSSIQVLHDGKWECRVLCELRGHVGSHSDESLCSLPRYQLIQWHILSKNPIGMIELEKVGTSPTGTMKSLRRVEIPCAVVSYL